MEEFPRNVAHLVYCETIGEALDQASAASLILVDEALGGDGLGLCRRLRTDPVTASLPIILRSSSRNRHPQANEVVGPHDLRGTIAAMIKLCPSLNTASEITNVPDDLFDDEEDVFDVEQSTVIWRKPEDITQAQWPPPPPEIDPNVDLLDFTRNFAGYANSLLEAYGQQATLSSADRRRLDQAARNTVGMVEEVMSTSQRAINDALMRKDVVRMRELSAARNVMHDKLRELRERVSQQEASSDESDTPLLPPPAPKAKSELTRAAEARDAARRMPPRSRRQTAPRPAQRSMPTGGVGRVTGRTARVVRPRRLRPEIFWIIGVVALLAGGLVAYRVIKRPAAPTAPKQTAGNTPPKLQDLLLERTSAAVVAKPQAVDAEGDQISYIIRWKVNGRVISGAFSARLLARHYRPGDTVQAEVTPTDQYGRGVPMLSKPLNISR